MLELAKPIWSDIAGINQYLDVKHVFYIMGKYPVCSYDYDRKNIDEFREKLPKSVLQICADTEYVVHINGNYVGTGQYRTFRGVKVYDEYDVSGFIRAGENEITVTAYCEGENSQTYQQDTPILIFAIQCGRQMILSGEETLVREHPCYESGRMEKVTPQLGYTYHYHAQPKEIPWKQAVVAEASFQYIPRPVKKLIHGKIVEGQIIAQGIVQRTCNGIPAEMMYSDGLFCKKREEIFDGNIMKYQKDGVFFVIDLKKEYAGLLYLKINAGEGTVLDIGWGEHLEDMRVRTSVGGRNFACRYVCKDGEQEFIGYFRRFGCRYLEIHITQMTGDIRLLQIGLIPTDYPLDREGSFVCNDFLINRLCEAASHTLKLCMHEHYEDCPWREQALYAFDSYIQMLCGYYHFGEYEFARASLKLLADGQKEDGMLPICAPSGIKMTIPSFALSWILSLEKYVLYSGDVDFGLEMLSIAERILGAFQVKDDLIQNDLCEDNWHFYEWSEGLDGKNISDEFEDSVINFYYILACEAYEKLCSYTGKAEKKVYHDPGKIRSALRKKYLDSTRGLFRTREWEERFHELTQALAVLSGTAEEPEKIREKLLHKNNGMVRLTLSTCLYKYEAVLAQDGRFEKDVLKEIADIWGKMLFSGADTLWEVEEGAAAFEDAGSLCHGWAAVPVYVLYKYYLGFEPTKPGFGEYKLQPRKNGIISEVVTTLFTPDWGKRIHIMDGNAEEEDRWQQEKM